MLIVLVVVDEFFLVPDVIARCEGLNWQLGQLLDDRLGHAEPARRVLDVDDGEVDLVPIDDVLQAIVQRAPAGLSDHVANVENADHDGFWVAELLGC